MRRIVSVVAVAAAMLMASALPVFAAPPLVTGAASGAQGNGQGNGAFNYHCNAIEGLHGNRVITPSGVYHEGCDKDVSGGAQGGGTFGYRCKDYGGTIPLKGNVVITPSGVYHTSCRPA